MTMTPKEQTEVEEIKIICVNLVKSMGGTITKINMGATHIILFQKEAPADFVKKFRLDQKIVNFEYITECYFRFMRIALEQNNP